MKIAKVLVGSPDNKKGFFNNVMERTKHLIDAEPNVDCYMIRVEHGLILRLLKRQFKRPKRDEFSVIEGMEFRNLWVTMGFFDYLIAYRLHRRIVISSRQLNSYIKNFEKYDLLSSHGTEAIFLSALVKQRFKVPFVATWHGSDINIVPFRSLVAKKNIKQLLNSADHNFFVSQKLLETANSISAQAKKSVLYTGPSSIFYRYNNARRVAVAKRYNVSKAYTVGFVGNFVPIKNVLLLPAIFKKLQELLNDISFIIVGDGELQQKMTAELTKNKIENVHILGKQDPKHMPDIMNVLDVLILPSLNEGLPRVTLEAQACGVHVVGSDRGGIPEAIGDANCFELNEGFVDAITSRILTLLQDKQESAELPVSFSWPNAIRHEREVHQNAYAK